MVLNRVSSTLLYQPAQSGRGENLWFLRWDTANPPSTIALEDTWANAGPPSDAGYFLFLNSLPPVTAAAPFEQKVRTLLPAPVTSGFGWLVYNSSSQSITVQTLLKSKLNGANQPVVDGDTQLVLLAGQESLGFSDGASLTAVFAGNYISGLVIGYPPLTGAQISGTRGVGLPLVGDLVGCVQFSGLTDALGKQAPQDSAIKTLVQVAIDPLHPLDPARNYELFTGQNFVLTQKGNSYNISRAS